MQAELFGNAAASTLSGSISSGDVTLVVASASSFPTGTGVFRILVESEIMIVTGVSGTTFTITRGAEGTSAASHTSGVAVTHIVTKDGIRRVSEQNFWPGTRAIGKTKGVLVENQSVGAGATYTICNLSGLGPGCISQMWMAISGGVTAAAREGSVLKIYRDGSGTEDVNASIAPLHGATYGPSSFNMNWMGWGSNSSYFNYFKMPFTDGFKITLTNADVSNGFSLFFMLNYVLTPNAFDWGRMNRFKVVTGDQLSTAANTVVTLCDISGRGVLFGVTQTWSDSNNTNFHFMEGNHKFYIDGEGSPSIQSSGTEDFYQNGGYLGSGVQIGPHVGTQLKNGTTSAGCYRFFDYDPIAFDTELKITWNCGDTAEASMSSSLAEHIWCVYYYLDQ